MKDEELWDLVIEGDKIAFSKLFHKLYKPLCHYALTILKSHEVAEEVVQETFIKLWENRQTVKICVSIRAYIYRTVHNNCISFYRNLTLKQKHDSKLKDEVARHASTVTGGLTESTLESIISGELEAVLEQTIQALPEQCHKIFNLCRYEQLSYQEIADKLGISVNTVKKQLSRAFAKIRKSYQTFKNN